MNTEEMTFKNTLKKNGYFLTRARLSLFEVLQNNNELTTQQLIALLPSQDTATVYRNIKLLEELGIINRLQLGWHSKLELSDVFHHHHHHLTCLNCGCVTTIPDEPELERQIACLVDGLNFKAIDHQLEIRGYCNQCQELSSVSAPEATSNRDITA